MTFGKLAKKTKNTDGDSLMVSATPLLEAAAATGDMRRPGMTRTQTLTERMTGGQSMEDASVQKSLNSVRQLSRDEDHANEKFQELMKWINETSAIAVAQKEAEEALNQKEEDTSHILDNDNNVRAVICSLLHDKPTIPHPAKKSIKVTTLQNLSPPHVRQFLHRLPLLLRILLNILSYFHPVFIKSITAGGSGKFLQYMLEAKVFPADSETGIKNLKARISSWLTDANFVFQIANIVGQASVPITTSYDIVNNLTFDDVMAYRTLIKEVDLTQIVRLGGADARISLPTFLLPHHEHLLPPPPSKQEVDDKRNSIAEADGKPKTVQAEQELQKTLKDETTFRLSTHVRLPACFDQSLLDFIAALVKVTKIIEMEKEDPVEKEAETQEKEGKTGFRQFAKSLGADVKGLGSDMKDSMRRVAIDAATNDRWIAKLVGKVTKRLETAQGDVGYSGDIPIALGIYRKNAESLTKLMP